MYIHLIRHPSPSIASFEEAKLHVFFPPFFTGQHRFTPSQLAELVWVICHQNISSFLQTISAQRKRAVRFEDLVRFPKKMMEELAEFLGLAFDPQMISPYDQDRRAQMTDAIHPMARMLGDVKFHQHKTISVAAAQRRQRRFAEKALGQVTRSLAGALGYNLRDRHHHTLVDLQTRGKRPAFFCVHPAGGHHRYGEQHHRLRHYVCDRQSIAGRNELVSVQANLAGRRRHSRMGRSRCTGRAALVCSSGSAGDCHVGFRRP